MSQSRSLSRAFRPVSSPASIAALAVLAGLGGCASTPGYAPAGARDEAGYYSTRLGEDRYRIVYNGGRTAGPATARDYALLRAAQVTLSDGRDWFQVVHRERTALSEERSETGFSVQRAWYVERDCGLLGCTQSVSPSTATRIDSGGGRTVTSWSYMLEIVTGVGELPAGGDDYYDADTVARALAH